MNENLIKLPIFWTFWVLLSLSASAFDEFATRCLESRRSLSEFKAVIEVSYPRIDGAAPPRYDGVTREYSIAISDDIKAYKAIQKWKTDDNEWVDVHLSTTDGTLRDQSTSINGTMEAPGEQDTGAGIDPRLFCTITDAPTSVGRKFPSSAFWFVTDSERPPNVMRNVILDRKPTVRVTYEPRAGQSVNVWYSVDCDYNPVRLTLEVPEHAYQREITCSYQRVSTNGKVLWFPKEINYKQSVDGVVNRVETARVKSVELGDGKDFDFSLSSLPLPEGRKIMSKGVAYKFSKGKLVPADVFDHLDTDTGQYVPEASAAVESSGVGLAFLSLVCSLFVVLGLLIWKFRKV